MTCDDNVILVSLHTALGFLNSPVHYHYYYNEVVWWRDIDWEERLRSDLFCVGCVVKP